jgi:hypothetical protein
VRNLLCILALVSAIPFTACHGPYACENPPMFVHFILADSAGNNLFDSSSNSLLQVTYLKEGASIIVSDIKVFDSFPKFNYVCTSQEMVSHSEKGIKEFQVTYGGRTDIFYLDAEEKHDGRCSYEVINTAKFNDAPVEDEHLVYGATYVLKRK